jgi:two-component system nitrate/nitrite response regulator NarL
MHVLLIDDHALFRAGMSMLFRRMDPDVEIIEADSLEAALAQQVTDTKPFDLILLDLALQGMNGLDGLRPLQRKFANVPVVMVTGSAEHDAMNEARAKGAKGYLIKTTAADAMMLALQKVLGGESHFSDDLGFAQTTAHMTPRQREVLDLLCQGKVNKEIASLLGMSDHTVRTHLKTVFRTLDVHTRTEAVLAARRLGMF